MIEFKARNPEYNSEEHWKTYGKWWKVPSKSNFGIYLFRIDGVVYERRNTEFIENFEKARMWEKLSD